MPVKGNTSSRTTSAIAPGTIDIRENPTQDISALSRNTENALNELGRIFDKKKIEEQQELAAVFGEEAFRLAHNMKDDGSGRKIIVHAAIAGLMSRITGAGFTSGAVAGALNEALINSLKGLDPGTAQIVSAILGAAAAKVAGGSAAAGASAAASGTKWNLLSEADYNEMKRRLAEAKTDEERKAIEEEYERKDEEQRRQEKEEEKILRRMGIPSNKIADYFNDNRYLGYRTLDGSLYLRTGDVSVTPPATTLVLKNSADYASGVALSVDESMFFGLMKELYKSITGHYPYASNSSYFLFGRLTGDAISMYQGLQEIAFGMGTMGGGIAAAALTGVGITITPAVAATGATVAIYGGATAAQAGQNLVEDISRFKASTSGSASPKNDFHSLMFNNRGQGAGGSKTSLDSNDSVDKILEKAVPRPEKRWAKQYDKTGGYEQAEKDFYSLDLEEGSVRDIKNGKEGILRDGRHVNVRRKSTEGHPTLEIINSRNKRTKIRYSD